MRRIAPVLFALVLASAPHRASAHDSARIKHRAPESNALVREGLERGSEGSLSARREALRQLEEAARLSPHDTRVLGALGHAYLDAGFTHAACETFEHVTQQDPRNADAWQGLGQVWKRDWLATLAPASLLQSIECFGNAARLEPSRADAWTTLAVLRVEQGDARGAGLCAQLALAADPDRGGPPLAAAYLAYHAGRLPEAESLFTVALPRLAPRLSARFRDISPLLPVQDGEDLAEMTPPLRAETVRRFWSASDPDPTTPTNEARLEYWARVAHAVLLFSDAWDPRWDMRAELYARYGSPEHVAYQPPGVALAQRPNEYDHWFQDERNGSRRVGDADPMWYPLHAQVWDYPQLGMRVVLEDRAISQHYELPRSQFAETDPAPDPEVMARNGLVSTSGGRGAFAALPPGLQPLALEGGLNLFEGEHGPRLLAHLATPNTPQPDLVAECVVIDSSEHEVARAARPLGASRCDAAASRAGDFTFDLPPGRYRVALAVSDGRGGRGVWRTRRDIAPPQRALSMSDVVLVCGPLDPAPAAGSVRLDPNLSARLGPDEPLLAYFEVYRLRSDSRGATRFDYEYSIRPLRADLRPWFRRVLLHAGSDQLTVRSEEEGAGSTRRQYIRVPLQTLPPGRYRLDVSVHDRLGGGSAHQGAEFTRLPAAGAEEPTSRRVPRANAGRD